jgi:hypothetical protein
MQVYILALILVALAIGGIAIKMFLVPGETFKKTCGSQFDPETGKAKSCACASGRPEDCETKRDEDGNRVTELIFKK